MVAAVFLLAGAWLLVWFEPWRVDVEFAFVDDAAVPVPEEPSIAVLPFSNLSNDPEQEYFSDGLTEDLIMEISRVSGLRVIARHSSFAYKGESGDVQKIGRELGAHYVVEGSVRKSGNRLRINALLINTRDGTHIWAKRYDRDLTDVFELQDEVTQTIVSALAVSLTAKEEDYLKRVKTVNLDAYDSLLRGLVHLHRFTKEDNAVAREFFSEAAAMDPRYARAQSNLALTYSRDVTWRWSDDPSESLRQAIEYANRAVDLADSTPQMSFMLSSIYLIQRQYDDAEASTRHALKLDPNYADGYGQLAFLLMHAGQLDDALTAIREAKRLNPRYPFVYLWIDGQVNFLMGNYEIAAASFKEVLDRNPVFVAARLMLVASYGQLGMHEDAEWEIEELTAVRPDLSQLSAAQHEFNYRRPGDSGRIIDGLRKAGLVE